MDDDVAATKEPVLPPSDPPGSKRPADDDEERPVYEHDYANDDEYLNGEFVTTVQQRGAAIIAARKFSSALSAASSVCDHVRDWVHGTPEGTWTSMGVISPGGDAGYGIEAGLMYSFPVTCAGGKWSIVQGLAIDDRSRSLMDATAAELKEEKTMAEELIAAM